MFFWDYIYKSKKRTVISNMNQAEKSFTLKNLNQNVIKVEYAVRGVMAQVSARIREELAQGRSDYPFDEVINANAGNPQIMGQKPITFYRQVTSICNNPELLKSDSVTNGAKVRAKFYLDQILGGIGAYAESPGYGFIRKRVADFLEKRDGVPSDASKVILTNGASAGIEFIMQALISSSDDGIMIPIPQYPLYSALLALMGAHEVPYYLDEESGWQITVDDLQRSYDQARSKGVNPRGIVLINPGNPTGQVLSADNIKSIVEFAYKNKLVLLADEVYQENIYKEGKEFVSFKKVVGTMAEPFNKAELFSFHSTSKGVIGECGLRGGYMEMFNIDPEVEAQIQKLKTVKFAANNNGQIVTDLMLNPPTEEECGKDVTSQFWDEKNGLLRSLKHRPKILYQRLNNMKNITCQEVEGAIYAFARIDLPAKAIEEAKKREMQPDLFYTLEALKATGICTLQGSGFRQKPGTWHFRITNLVTPHEKLEKILDALKSFNDEFMNKFE